MNRLASLEDLAQQMFEAAEVEAFRALGEGLIGRPRRWTAIDQVKRDQWMAAARIAWTPLTLAQLGEHTYKTRLSFVKGKLRDTTDLVMLHEGEHFSRDSPKYHAAIVAFRAFGEDDPC